MKNLFQNRAVGFWLDLAGTVLTLVGIILYALYAADTGSNNVWVYIGLVAAVAAGAAGLVTDNDLLAIAAPALSAVSLCAFITDFRLYLCRLLLRLGDVRRRQQNRRDHAYLRGGRHQYAGTSHQFFHAQR